MDYQIVAIVILTTIVVLLLLDKAFYSHRKRLSDKPVGTLHVFEDEDDGPCIFLELERHLNEIAPAKFVTLEIEWPNEARK